MGEFYGVTWEQTGNGEFVAYLDHGYMAVMVKGKGLFDSITTYSPTGRIIEGASGSAVLSFSMEDMVAAAKKAAKRRW